MRPIAKHNADNERVKRRYFAYLREANRYSETSVDGAAAAIHRFETFTRFKGFKAFHIEQAIGFKKNLIAQRNPKTNKPLSHATLRGVLAAIKRFFLWLAGQPGYKSRISYSDAEYFNLPAKENRIATTKRERPVPTIDQIRAAISAVHSNTDIGRRDRALLAFTLLTGARDSALASLKMKHVDLSRRRVHQDAREVKTKFSKTFTTAFFPVGEDIEIIVTTWLELLAVDKLFGPDDPVFPRTLVALDDKNRFCEAGFTREHWSSAEPIRRIFRQRFADAGLPYFNPHSFRNTLVQLGEQTCQTPEEFKAWSQNLGHEKVLTTLTSYGAVTTSRQCEILERLGDDPKADMHDLEALQRLIDHMKRNA